MGFYIRKAFNFGPLRLNLSRSGLGTSFGVKGARIGAGPRGSYVHMGRGGLYYRQTLHSTHHSPAVNPIPQPVSNDVLQEISSASAAGIIDGTAAQLLIELNRVKRTWDLFPIICLAGTALFVHLLFLDVWWGFYAIETMCLVGLSLLARNNDVTYGTAILNYSFDEHSKQSFEELRSAFTQLAACRGMWHVDAAGATTDWKRNAGAISLSKRTPCSANMSRPRKVASNIDVPTLNLGRRALYFFPDRLLVYDTSGVGAVSYAELNINIGQTRFVEDSSVPSDAKQVGSTWRYVNRNGGPDRRFNNNRQLPILLYGEMSLTSSSGLNELLQYSVPDCGSKFAGAVGALRTATPGAAYNTTEDADVSSMSTAKVVKTYIELFSHLSPTSFQI
jgi:hypothetical protein